MFFFRLIDFALRLLGSFFFVFLLQIRFDGKTLESYVSHFGQKFVVTRTLHKVSEDGVKAIRSFSSQEHLKPQLQRQLSGSKATKIIKSFGFLFSLPSEQKKEKE